MTECAKAAVSLDLDGVVFKRIPFQVEALPGYFLHGRKIFQPFSLPSSVDRTVVDRPISSARELLMYEGTKQRKLKKGVKEFIESASISADLYVNTGRPAKKAWVEMTSKLLEKEGIGQYFKDAFFKPEGMSSKISKALAIEELIDQGYEDIIHYDDNPEDVLPLASMFPQVKFVIVQDLSTGMLFSRREAQKYPNVRRIASFDTTITQSNIV